MPTVSKTGNYHVNDNNALSFNVPNRNVTVFLHNVKVDKHVVGQYWPQQQGGLHTGIVAEDIQSELRLYAQFAADFEFVFEQKGSMPIWIELEYQEKELPAQVFGADVNGRDFYQFKKLKVGASICSTNNGGCAIHINHGPYPVNS